MRPSVKRPPPRGEAAVLDPEDAEHDRRADDQPAQVALGRGQRRNLLAPDPLELCLDPFNVDRLAALLSLDLLFQVGLPILGSGGLGVFHAGHHTARGAAGQGTGAVPPAASAATICGDLGRGLRLDQQKAELAVVVERGGGQVDRSDVERAVVGHHDLAMNRRRADGPDRRTSSRQRREGRAGSRRRPGPGHRHRHAAGARVEQRADDGPIGQLLGLQRQRGVRPADQRQQGGARRLGRRDQPASRRPRGRSDRIGGEDRFRRRDVGRIVVDGRVLAVSGQTRAGEVQRQEGQPPVIDGERLGVGVREAWQ